MTATPDSEQRIFLSPPDVGPAEREALLRAFDSNWIAPAGPELAAFEAECAAVCGVPHGVALSSGTAALHLALLTLGIGPGDDVVVPTLTFAATANAVTYCGARPVFVDADAESWNLDPDLLAKTLASRAQRAELPKAVITVDLYGQCCDYDAIGALCDRYEIPLVADSAEALGATWKGRPAASHGVAAALSFNGNKIITTSGGGMLVTNDPERAERVRYLSTQARQPVSHYEHVDIGFNYRLSNLLAALGRAQLTGLAAKVARRGAVRARYEQALIPLVESRSVTFNPLSPAGESNHWLTCITIDAAHAGGVDCRMVERVLAAHNIESRPIWKPMHLQPVYAAHPACLNGVSDRVFGTGLCLPSGSNLTEADQGRVIDALGEAFGVTLSA